MERDIITDARSFPMSEKPRAMVIYTEAGDVATIFTDPRRCAPVGLHPTDAEAARLFRTMVCFAGRYEVAGNELTYYPEVTWNESWSGSRQTRYFEISHDVLQIRSVPAFSALLNAETEMTMVWARESRT
jgi:hypothetical protein